MIDRNSFKNQVYYKIKESIITGELSQGEALNERKLAQDLGISRTPIREALQLLNKDGWVIIEPYKGAMVRIFDQKYITSVLEVRKPLEILAASEAVLNARNEDLEFLRINLEKQEECLRDYSPAKFMVLDREFHKKIYDLSNNELLIDILENINDVIRFLGIQILSLPERHITTYYEHKQIYEGIKSGDIEEAKKYMGYHMIETANHTLQRRWDGSDE